jgi:hypothetical protein
MQSSGKQNIIQTKCITINTRFTMGCVLTSFFVPLSLHNVLRSMGAPVWWPKAFYWPSNMAI